MIWWSRAAVDLALTGYLWAGIKALVELLARPARRRVVSARALATSAWCLHTVGLGLRALAEGALPVGGLHVALSLVVWAAVLLLLAGECRYELRSLPAFVLPPIAVLGLVAASMPEAAVFRSSGTAHLEAHALLVILGLGALAGNSAGGLMYVLQERALRKGRLPGLSRRLPPLDTLDRFSYEALIVGFAFLTLGIAVGAVSATLAHGAGWFWQPTTPVAAGTWAIYGASLYFRAAGGWGGRRAAYLAVAGFAGLVATLGVSLLLPIRHVLL